MDTGNERSEIVFFDLETIVPTQKGEPFAILEFGAILVDSRKLVELESYSTLVRPVNLSLLNSLSTRCNGITRDAVLSAPTFADISNRVYDLLHGRIWAGHNIVRFDCARIREAFAEIGRLAPEPRGMIDSLAILTEKFGRRAGNMKMASLASYFNIGKQVHRSLDDVRMNLDVVKHCATVLFLESSAPDMFPEKSWVSPNVTTRSRSNGKGSHEELKSERKSRIQKANSSTTSSTIIQNLEKNFFSSLTIDDSPEKQPDSSDSKKPDVNTFDMAALSNELMETVHQDVTEDKHATPTSNLLLVSDDGCVKFLETYEVSIPSITVSAHNHSGRMRLIHKDVTLQLFCGNLRVRFGLSTKFLDHAGRPRLSFTVNAPLDLCRVLDACDEIVQRFIEDSGSEWRPAVTRKQGFERFPTVRLNLRMVEGADAAAYSTEVHKEDCSGSSQKLMGEALDSGMLEGLIVPGVMVDAWFSLQPFDYQQNAGVKLVAKKLVFSSKGN